jgi:hypothetical protein
MNPQRLTESDSHLCGSEGALSNLSDDLVALISIANLHRFASSIYQSLLLSIYIDR